MGRTTVIRLLVALAAGFLLVGTAAPARAHSELTSSDPKDGASLQTAPERVTLTFSEDVLAQGSAVTVTSVAADERLDVGATRVDGARVSVSWPEVSPSGAFRIAYRVVSADGHPINGTIRITVAQPNDAAAPREGSAGTAPSPGGQPSAEPSGAAQPQAAASPSSSPVAADGEGGGRWVAWIIGISLAVLVGVAAGTWIMRRSR